jgi:hypothetical protein
LKGSEWGKIPHVIVGDFNSLSTPSDYTPLEMKNITETRQKYGKEKPKVITSE